MRRADLDTSAPSSNCVFGLSQSKRKCLLKRICGGTDRECGLHRENAGSRRQCRSNIASASLRHRRLDRVRAENQDNSDHRLQQRETRRSQFERQRHPVDGSVDLDDSIHHFDMALRMEDNGSRHPQDAVDFGDRLLRRACPRQTEVTPPRRLAVGRLVRGGKIGIKDEKRAADAADQRNGASQPGLASAKLRLLRLE